MLDDYGTSELKELQKIIEKLQKDKKAKDILNAKELALLEKQLNKENDKDRHNTRLDDIQTEAELRQELEEDVVYRVTKLQRQSLVQNEEVAAKYADAFRSKLEKERLQERIKEEKEVFQTMMAYQKEQDASKKKKGKTETDTLNKIEKSYKNGAQLLIEAQKTTDEKQKKKKEKEAKKAFQEGEVAEEVLKKQKEYNDKNEGGYVAEIKKKAEVDAAYRKTAEGKAEARNKRLESGLKAVGSAIKDGLNAINNAMNEYLKNQTNINARLQGISSYKEITKNLGDVAYSPLLKTEDLYNNVYSLISAGIVTNVEQRAFFETIKGGIAETFSVNESYMKRLIKIQQNDSTAARLGMESYLTRWLNEYVENTEYLTDTFDSVASSLLEASAVIGAGGNTGGSLVFEEAVQQWLGAMTGVGFSSETAQSIASALGQLGSGNIEVLNSEIGQLLTIAAANANQNIGEMLVDGLDASKTNILLKSAVEFLQNIANDSSNNVTKAEMAKMFGVSMSDLVSISNLNTEKIASEVSKNTYEGMYTELTKQFKELPSRVGLVNMVENAFKNFTYQQGMKMASNPVSMIMWKLTDLVQNATGGHGINIPAIMAFANMIDLEATVENLVKLGMVGVSTLFSMPKIIKGIGTAFNGSKLLENMDISQNNAGFNVTLVGTTAKTQTGPRTSSIDTSNISALKGNSDEDIATAVVNDSENSQKEKQKKLMDEAEESDPTLKYLSKKVKLDAMLRGIYLRLGGVMTSDGTILDDVVSDKSSLIDTEKPTAATTILGAIANSVSSIVPAKILTDEAYNKVSNIEGTLTDIKGILSKATTSTGGLTTNTNIVTSSVNLIVSMANMSDISNNETLQSIISSSSVSNIGGTNISGDSVTSTTKSSDYLEDIQFGDGFKQLVSDVAEIKNRLISNSTSNNTNTSGSIDSFNPGSYNPQQYMHL